MSLKKKQQNYLDYIPVRNPDLPWEENGEHQVTVFVTWRGFYHKIAQTFFGKPKTSKISLDAFGSFIWMQIDGEKNVYEISKAVKAKFGKKAEPLLERLVKFFEILKDQKFIRLKEPKR